MTVNLPNSYNNDSALGLAQRVNSIQPSPTLAISALAEELQTKGKPIINLSVGEPDFDTPAHIKEAAIKAIEAGFTKYTAVDGIKSLKHAIRNKFLKENQLKYDLNQILVSCGAKHSLYNLFSAIINPGDEVIIPAPYWVSYPDIVKLAEGQPIIVNTEFKNRFKIDPAQLESAITEKTRAVILNSPSNPTGFVYSKEELLALANVILKYPHILVVSDDIYEHNLWVAEPFSNIVNACPALHERSIVINGVSKSYAMTGWRIGYAAGPTKIINAMKKAQSQSTSNPASISQYAALAALEGDQGCIAQMTQAYKERHDFVLKSLQNIPGIQCEPSDGTFYSFPCVKDLLNNNHAIDTDLKLAEYLLNKAEIAVVPGSAFGTKDHLRISFATNMENLKTAMGRLHEVLTLLHK